MNNRGKVRFRKLKRSTCFGIGIAGAVVGIITGVLTALHYGQVMYGRTGAMVLYGAMLLLLGTREKGQAHKGRRTGLLILFFMLLLGNLGLPLLDILAAFVLPALLVMYRADGDGPLLVVLVLAEAAKAVVDTLAIMPGRLGSDALLVQGVVLVAVSLVRGVVLVCLLRRAQKQQAKEEQQDPNA